MTDKAGASSEKTPRVRKRRPSSSTTVRDQNGGKSRKRGISPQKTSPKKTENCHRHPWWCAVWRAGIVAIILSVVLMITAEIYVGVQSAKKHSSEAGNLPSDYVGLVLGCSPTLGNLENAYFTHRMKKAAELWRSGNVRCLIVSGDNRAANYNEPEEMKKDLIKRGVPEKYIVCDYAGLRTLDSVVRSHKIFGADKIAVVSQEFHNKRALAIAAHFGIEARAVDAEDVELASSSFRLWVRERAARVALLIDLFLLDREPYFMGTPVSLPSPPDRRPRGSYISF